MAEQRLICVEDFLKELREKKKKVCYKDCAPESWESAFLEFEAITERATAVDTVPIVHGHWVYNKDTGEIRCNLCNALVGVTMCPDDVEMITEVENFCFNCGAKMDEGSV